MRKKIVLITGSTDGIGKQTAVEISRAQHSVIIHGRNKGKAEKCAGEIIVSSGNNDVEYTAADFSSLEKVKQMADEIKSRHSYLDVLINNAAIYSKKKIITVDGFELTFAVNYLSHFLLTILLSDLLKKSEGGRIINVSSSAHSNADFDFGNLNGEKYYDAYNAYSISKMGNLLFTMKLAGKLKDEKITVNALHPGVISTKLLHAGFGSGGADVSQGAETPVYLSLSDEVKDESGKYFVSKKEAKAASTVYDKNFQSRLWNLSMEMVSKFL
jgi:NAD(P)-dependent dehydrogenase (short-subunit alcohol dehydrogenase family)